MVLALLVAHLIGVVGSGLAGRISMRAGLLVAAVAPAATAVWAIQSLIAMGEPLMAEFVWVEGLDLTLRFRLDGLGLLMTVLVSGIGALVFVYATGYFSPDDESGTRFPPSLLAFSTSMLGLVWADSIWTFFIFWELTSITSFLLVGHKNVDHEVRLAARRALLITGTGGLALLAGLIVLADASGVTTLTDLGPVGGTSGWVAALLVLIGAATKSAQVPFHVWLPGAMKAPTPVSAYLHSATMVKAGVLLVAVTGSAFVEVPLWKSLGLTLGIASMLWGGVGALRHRDAKLILAWGTVSQLGLLVTLLALGNPKATFAAVSMLFAHALFKAALFLAVGEIDIRTGTRDITELGGLARSMPVTFAVTLAAGLSMAGVPPLLGFAAKEAAIEAVLGLDGFDGALATVGVVGGAAVTVAYTLRLLIGLFGPASQSQTTQPQAPTTQPATTVGPQRLAMTIPAVTLSLAGLAGFVLLGTVNAIVSPAATELDAKADVYELLRWPGLTTGLGVSLAVIVVGGGIGVILGRRVTGSVPQPVGADAADAAIDGVLDAAPRLTAAVQHGSLPVYLATMATAAVLAAVPFLTDVSTDGLVLWDHPLQAILVLGVLAAAAAGALVGTRLGAALSLGAVGIGASGLFLLHGAPDLALTQLLVETIVVVGFVLGLGHLAREFPRIDNTWRAVRVVVAVAGGAAVTFALAASAANSVNQAPIDALVEGAVEEGGGNNVVNVILTDLRALDTLGEVVVLATVAVGILALARLKETNAS